MASETPPQTTAPMLNAEAWPRLLRVHATPDGESHLQDLTVRRPTRAFCRSQR